ncbi:MAG: GNAT family N-acetyltransferase [Methanomassiliicoccaceae archaeon]|nr:GNAT family N-acetyltransferase [Methanomassiliicoccaceae archaeon]
MTDYTYHLMTVDDHDEMYALWKDATGIILGLSDDRDSVSSYLIQNPDQSFVCRTGGRMVGTILCGNDGRRAYIYHVAVAPEHRRHGIAAELVRLSTNVQKELGIQRCHLFILNDNELGREFWHEMGFIDRPNLNIMSMDIQ